MGRPTREQMKKLLEEKTKALARSNAELERFAYIASHDLQEPLRMVASYTQLLERRYKDKLDEDANEFIAFAVDGASRMQIMINGLLTYSRINRMGGEFELLELESVLEKALVKLRVPIEKSGASIKHDPLPKITADSAQMTQLFLNLISNAIKFSHNEEKPEIHISAEKGETEWLFSVKDNGIGLNKEYFERVFHIFHRPHGTKYPGAGIGLSISERIIDRHGGRIWVESELGEGSAFYFTIPFKTGDENGY